VSCAAVAKALLWTGQVDCYNEQGNKIACENTGQDAEFQTGLHGPQPRFLKKGDQVEDCLTGLYWTRKSNFAEFPLNWQESLDFIRQMNQQTYLGFNDWRLPNRRELYSLLSFQHSRPALPEGHPFDEVFPGWYWTSTSAAISPDHAWYIHMDGARMFYGGKDQSYLVWPVRGSDTGVFIATGQQRCYDHKGQEIECLATGQDGEYRVGRQWPENRFCLQGDIVEDRLTGLQWLRQASLGQQPVNWQQALAQVAEFNQQSAQHWRLPSINELESLVDCSRARPALAAAELFSQLKDVYWSSSTSLYEPDWAWALYMNKGAVGVGQKYLPAFHVWPVSGIISA